MAECPKCKSHLRLTDWKQHCPHCGANIVVYDLQERLMLEADKAEVEYYHFQKKIDRIKTAFVGSKLSIVRIITSLIPIAALFLPIVKITLQTPFEPYDGNLGILQLYNMFEKINLGVFAELIANDTTKTAALMFTLATVFLLLSVVIMLVHFICLLMSYGKHGKQRNYTLDGIFLILVLAAMALFIFMPENTFAQGTLSIGAYLYLVLVIVNFVVDILVFKENIEIKHAQCYVGGIPIEEYFEMQKNGATKEELRAEMYKRLTEIQLKQEEEIKQKAREEAAVNG